MVCRYGSGGDYESRKPRCLYKPGVRRPDRLYSPSESPFLSLRRDSAFGRDLTTRFDWAGGGCENRWAWWNLFELEPPWLDVAPDWVVR